MIELLVPDRAKNLANPLPLLAVYTHAAGRYNFQKRRLPLFSFLFSYFSSTELMPVGRDHRSRLQIPRQRIKIDIASRQNNADTLLGDIELPFLNRSVRDRC